MHEYSFTISLHNHIRKDKTQLLYFDAHINKERIRLKMGVAVLKKYFNKQKTSTFPLSAFSKRYFPEDEKGKLFKYGNSQKLNINLKAICEYLGIDKDVTSHSARHTFATNFILSGGQVAVLKELLGHSDIKTTMIYVHITHQVERDAIRVFDDFLSF